MASPSLPTFEPRQGILLEDERPLGQELWSWCRNYCRDFVASVTGLGSARVIRRVFSGLEKIPPTQRTPQILPITFTLACLVLVLRPPGSVQAAQELESQQSITATLLPPPPIC